MEERPTRMAKGLCFNCDEAYAPGHRCKGKLFRMDAKLGCLVEMCEEIPGATDLEDLDIGDDGMKEISLQAL